MLTNLLTVKPGFCSSERRAPQRGTNQMWVYLLLTQDQHALWFDWMIWSQVLPAAPHDSILESLPNTITSGPGHTDMMPLAVIDQKRQLRNLLGV